MLREPRVSHGPQQPFHAATEKTHAELKHVEEERTDRGARKENRENRRIKGQREGENKCGFETLF